MINLDKKISVSIYFLILFFIVSLAAGYFWCYFAFDEFRTPPKRLAGKYIRHTNAPMEVMNQWDNAPDTVAYSTFDSYQVIRFYREYGCSDEVIEELGPENLEERRGYESNKINH